MNRDSITKRINIHHRYFSQVKKSLKNVTNPFRRNRDSSLTLIREFWKKNPKRGTITERVSRKKNPERSVASFVYVPLLWIFFPKIALGHGPKKWHTFLFSTAYYRTYWHMPFRISTIRKPNRHCICTYNFYFFSPNCDVTSDDSGFFFQKTRSVMVPKKRG